MDGEVIQAETLGLAGLDVSETIWTLGLCVGDVVGAVQGDGTRDLMVRFSENGDPSPAIPASSP